MDKKPFVIAVCGASCSGKTTIASRLAEQLNRNEGVSEAEINARLLAAQSLDVDSSPRIARSLTRVLSGDADADSPPSLTRAISGPAAGLSDLQRARSGQFSQEENQIHKASTAITADDFFVFDEYLTDSCPQKEVNGRVWKDWESVDSIDWSSFVWAVKKARADPQCPKYLVVEGFLLLATPESRELFDAVVDVKLSKDECWKRRKGRAESMQHLPPGFSVSDDDPKNYEVLQTYVKSNATESEFSSAAVAQFAAEGDLAWLRLYFEEVIWPAAEEQQKASAACGLPMLQLDACVPEGKEAWQEANFPKALDFVRNLFQDEAAKAL